MNVSINGVLYDRFISLSAEIRLDALSNTFSFTAGGESLFVIGDQVQIFAADKLVLTGYIEVINGSYSSNDRSFTYSGRDKTGDFLDSSISSLSDIKSPISLKSLIERVIDNIGSSISVIDNAEPPLFNASEDVAAPEPGEPAFQFVEKYARKRQVLLTSDEFGNIVIQDTPGASTIHAIQNVTGADNNNVISASFSYDTTGRFNAYKMSSGLNPTLLTGGVGNSDIVNQKSTVIDANIRAGRQLVLTPESSYSSTENSKRVQWESRIRKSRGQLYSAVVQGHTVPDSSDLWRINTVIGVLDDFAGINAEMLINTLTYSVDSSGGELTTISLVEQNAYNLQLREPVTQEIGSGYAF